MYWNGAGQAERKKIYEDTIILFTTDHGIAALFCKCTLFDGGIGVALILRVPGKKANAYAIDGLVSHIDIFPTLCDILGLEKPEWLDGISLAPMLNRPDQKLREAVFAEVNFHTSYEPIRCIRTERYKYMRYYGGWLLCTSSSICNR